MTRHSIRPLSHANTMPRKSHSPRRAASRPHPLIDSRTSSLRRPTLLTRTTLLAALMVPGGLSVGCHPAYRTGLETSPTNITTVEAFGSQRTPPIVLWGFKDHIKACIATRDGNALLILHRKAGKDQHRAFLLLMGKNGKKLSGEIPLDFLPLDVVHTSNQEILVGGENQILKLSGDGKTILWQRDLQGRERLGLSYGFFPILPTSDNHFLLVLKQSPFNSSLAKFDASTGEMTWEFSKTATKPETYSHISSLSQENQRGEIAFRDALGNLYKINGQGELVWKVKNRGNRPIMTSEGDVYVPYGPELRKYDRSDGRLLWTRNFAQGRGGLWPFTLMPNGNLLVGNFSRNEKSSVSLFDSEGEKIWETYLGIKDFKFHDRFVGSPVVTPEGNILVLLTFSGLYNITPQGEILWHINPIPPRVFQAREDWTPRFLGLFDRWGPKRIYSQMPVLTAGGDILLQGHWDRNQYQRGQNVLYRIQVPGNQN